MTPPLQVPVPVNGETRVVLLSAVEAELLHARLCHALSGEPAPSGAPECRFDQKLDPRRRRA
ncbi:hypothetical protein SXIM_34030 [Streptomyces xiamenensis]|uniref:Uncharacterized protein n=1 Tax=Streptomyces xiamenensis TaxID=408015 RepID=A0A0F7FW65_9ACTN|nr:MULTISPECIES: hypothetical protein [Streptomyces]AKG44787.1 hypothetical protein SXIM_34030 [Streptomyces xiamenensis]